MIQNRSKFPIPLGLKRALLAVWNGGHRLAWRVGEYGGALRHRRFDRCVICGRWGPKLYRRWVIRPELERRSGVSPRVAEAWARKESNDCPFCGSKLRARRIAEVILALYPVGEPPLPARSIREWVSDPSIKTLRVAEVNEIEGLHRFLEHLPRLSYSEYNEEADPGTVVNGVRCESLEQLTYSDESFDLIVSSETLEHVPDLSSALREIHRVLRAGGWHLFTVPLFPGTSETFARASRNEDGQVEFRGTPIHHPGGDWGYLVYTEFGTDLPERLREAGFEVELAFGPIRDDDLGQVFCCRKPSKDQAAPD